jgi:hypothetical protein
MNDRVAVEDAERLAKLERRAELLEGLAERIIAVLPPEAQDDQLHLREPR